MAYLRLNPLGRESFNAPGSLLKMRRTVSSDTSSNAATSATVKCFSISKGKGSAVDYGTCMPTQGE